MLGRNIGLIVFVLFVAWQVVTAIINQINANKQQQQAEELAKRRRQSASSPGGQVEAGGGKSRVDDLAARRKAQLEELRRRREAGKSAPTIAEARIGGPVATTPTQTRQPAGRSRNQPIVIEPATRERRTDPWQARQDALRGERQAKLEKAQRDAQARAAQQARSQKMAAREQAAVQQRADLRSTQRARAEAAEAAETLAAAQLGTIRSRAHNPQELRELFVLKELLDPPLALRQEQR